MDTPKDIDIIDIRPYTIVKWVKILCMNGSQFAWCLSYWSKLEFVKQLEPMTATGTSLCRSLLPTQIKELGHFIMELYTQLVKDSEKQKERDLTGPGAAPHQSSSLDQWKCTLTTIVSSDLYQLSEDKTMVLFHFFQISQK